jgi:HPt (histidine-containing phosphotransfer) domain-containing protein
MDDYICKPIVLHALRGKIEQWLHQPKSAQPQSINGHTDLASHAVTEAPNLSLPNTQTLENKPGETNTRLVDLSVLENYVGTDKGIQKQFLQGFLADSRPLVKGLNATDVSLGTIKNTAHQLKSSAKAIGAQSLADEFYALEQAAKAEDIEQVQVLQKVCHEKFNAACVEIETILG